MWRAKEGDGRLSGCVGMLCLWGRKKGATGLLWKRKMGLLWSSAATAVRGSECEFLNAALLEWDQKRLVFREEKPERSRAKEVLLQ